ncbi:asparaginase-domain-containing protein [Chaetomium strumarium]|uniref:asparaginase n=1 Tax=Chaetomium strumarium TaxID=1170767 RepID=A0AAJ0M3Y2_9PEZI|nr:asparaginase-domain-containing protein [Chaetomium strumarium]
MGGSAFIDGKPTQSHYPESRVLIIMTGGTICMQPSADGLVPMTGFLENAMAPRPSFNDGSTPPVKIHAYKNGVKLTLDSLRTPPTTYSRHIRYGILEFHPLLDSSSISSMGWTEIAMTIKENYHYFDGFVVLHGTDSLAYTASALSFMMSDLGKPVILTGSQASIFALQSDAVDNLLGSLIIAGTFVIPEVCLFFHHTLFRGNRTTKVSASSFEAFDSPNCEPLAKVTSLGVDVNWTLVRRPTRIAEFQVTKYLDTAHVACLRIFPGIKPEMVDSVLRVPNLRGLILETFGMGNAPGGVDGSLTKVIREAVQRGIVIVNVSQCTNGFVSPLYAPGTALGRAGVVFGFDLTTEAALTKLSYLLALPGLEYKDIAAEMAHSLRGEMTETTTPSFSHPAGSIDSAVGRLTVAALGYAIRNGELRTVREILEGDEFSHQLLKRADYAGNTVLHLAAVGPEPQVLRELLMRGASVHARNRANNTPLYLAEKMGNAECVRLLKEAGAHLWLDNELKGEGSRVPSQRASRAVSPERGPRSQPNGGPVREGHGKEEEEKDEAAAERDAGSDGNGNGVGLAQAEPARSLLTGDKGSPEGPIPRRPTLRVIVPQTVLGFKYIVLNLAPMCHLQAAFLLEPHPSAIVATSLIGCDFHPRSVKRLTEEPEST